MSSANQFVKDEDQISMFRDMMIVVVSLSDAVYECPFKRVETNLQHTYRYSCKYSCHMSMFLVISKLFLFPPHR